MKDTILRGIVLEQYYLRRREEHFLPEPEDFSPHIPLEDILSISDQLGQHGLIDWRGLSGIGGFETGVGKITAFGIDVMENGVDPGLNIEFVQNKTIHINESSNVVVGDHNDVSFIQHIQEVTNSIDRSNGTPEQKAEARTLLARFLEHPLVTAIAGGAASGAVGLFRP